MTNGWVSSILLIPVTSLMLLTARKGFESEFASHFCRLRPEPFTFTLMRRIWKLCALFFFGAVLSVFLFLAMEYVEAGDSAAPALSDKLGFLIPFALLTGPVAGGLLYPLLLGLAGLPADAGHKLLTADGWQKRLYGSFVIELQKSGQVVDRGIDWVSSVSGGSEIKKVACFVGFLLPALYGYSLAFLILLAIEALPLYFFFMPELYASDSNRASLGEMHLSSFFISLTVVLAVSTDIIDSLKEKLSREVKSAARRLMVMLGGEALLIISISLLGDLTPDSWITSSIMRSSVTGSVVGLFIALLVDLTQAILVGRIAWSWLSGHPKPDARGNSIGISIRGEILKLREMRSRGI